MFKQAIDHTGGRLITGPLVPCRLRHLRFRYTLRPEALALTIVLATFRMAHATRSQKSVKFWVEHHNTGHHAIHTPGELTDDSLSTEDPSDLVEERSGANPLLSSQPSSSSNPDPAASQTSADHWDAEFPSPQPQSADLWDADFPPISQSEAPMDIWNIDFPSDPQPAAPMDIGNPQPAITVELWDVDFPPHSPPTTLVHSGNHDLLSDPGPAIPVDLWDIDFPSDPQPATPVHSWEPDHGFPSDPQITISVDSPECDFPSDHQTPTPVDRWDAVFPSPPQLHPTGDHWDTDFPSNSQPQSMSDHWNSDLSSVTLDLTDTHSEALVDYWNCEFGTSPSQPQSQPMDPPDNTPILSSPFFHQALVPRLLDIQATFPPPAPIIVDASGSVGMEDSPEIVSSESPGASIPTGHTQSTLRRRYRLQKPSPSPPPSAAIGVRRTNWPLSEDELRRREVQAELCREWPTLYYTLPEPPDPFGEWEKELEDDNATQATLAVVTESLRVMRMGVYASIAARQELILENTRIRHQINRLEALRDVKEETVESHF
ncbi:hypothetical protein Hypma_008141 [Hypsizygus marmoreus]|uniref:Uncharacterized protein n=1 Tax=Hypsizygus marmoreus TaxID=39966 RepID=A0A369JS47_HYPMA|nr:hypothetical protein Hypma_008141 [Hypsizygus marmoreus]